MDLETLDLEIALLRSKTASKREFVRDSEGRFAETPGDSSLSGDLSHAEYRKRLYGEYRGTPEDPVPCEGDIERAARVIADGGNVKLDQPDEVSTLLDKLRTLVKEAEDKGEKAPLYDLCKVSVPGTNLFCQDHVEGRDKEGNVSPIERVQMPQLSTKDPRPGSEADKKPRNDKGEVNLSEDFAKFLASSGREPTLETRPASHLRASQNELNGAKVAGIAGAVADGKIDVTDPSGAIYVTEDNYVIDGHHRWAAYVAEGIRTGEDIDMPVIVVHTDIGTALTVADYWTDQMGIPPADASKKGADPWLYRTMTRVPEMADVIAKFAEANEQKEFDPAEHPRDSEGRFAETLGGGNPLAGAAATPQAPSGTAGSGFGSLGDPYRTSYSELPNKVYHVAPASEHDSIEATGLDAGGHSWNWALSQNDRDAGGNWNPETQSYEGAGSEDFGYRPEGVYVFADPKSAVSYSEYKTGQQQGRLEHQPDQLEIYEIDAQALGNLPADQQPDLLRNPELVQMGHLDDKDAEAPLRDIDEIFDDLRTVDYGEGEVDGREWVLERVPPEFVRTVKPYELKDQVDWTDDDIDAYYEDHPEEDDPEFKAFDPHLHPRDSEGRFAETPGYTVVAEQLNENAVIMRATAPDGTQVGYMSFRQNYGEWEVGWAETSPELRRTGVAQHLLEAFHEEFPDRTVVHHNFESRAGREWAHRMVELHPGWNRLDAKAFDPGEHPRDNHGRFAEKPGGDLPELRERSAIMTPGGLPGFISSITSDLDGVQHATVIESGMGPGEGVSYRLDDLTPIDTSDAVPIYDSFGKEQHDRFLTDTFVVNEDGLVQGVLGDGEARSVRRTSDAYRPPFEIGQRVVATTGEVGILRRYTPRLGLASVELADGTRLADVTKGMQHAGTWDTPAGFEAAGVEPVSGRAREVYTGRGTKDKSKRIYAIEYPGSYDSNAGVPNGMRAALKSMVVDNHKLEKDSGLDNAWRGTLVFAQSHELRSSELAHKDWNCSITVGVDVIRGVKETGASMWNPKDGEDERLVMIHELAHGLSNVGQSEYISNVAMEEGVVDGYAKAFVTVERFGTNAEVFPADGPSPRPPGGDSSGYPQWVDGLTSAQMNAMFGLGPNETLIPEDASYTWGDRLDYFRDLLKKPLPERESAVNEALERIGERLVLTGNGIGTRMGFSILGKSVPMNPDPKTTEDVIALIFSVENLMEAERVADVVSDWVARHPEDAYTVGWPAEALAMFISAHEPVEETGAKAFDSHLHPRDSEGRFAETPGGSVVAELLAPERVQAPETTDELEQTFLAGAAEVPRRVAQYGGPPVDEFPESPEAIYDKMNIDVARPEDVTPKQRAVCEEAASEFLNDPRHEPLFDAYGEPKIAIISRLVGADDDAGTDPRKKGGVMAQYVTGTMFMYGSVAGDPDFAERTANEQPGFSVGGAELQTTLMHEYGHHVMMVIGWDEEGERNAFMESFINAIVGDGDSSEINTSQVSTYAGTTVNECFAEFFATVTDPNFDIDDYDGGAQEALQLLVDRLKDDLADPNQGALF